jgi:hypothetical protein
VQALISSLFVLPSLSREQVGTRIVTFEACSGFTHVMARLLRSAASRGLCRKAPIQTVTHPNRLPASELINLCSGGYFLHWLFAPSGRTPTIHDFKTSQPWVKPCFGST